MVPTNPHSPTPSFQKGSELPVRLALLIQLSAQLSKFLPIPDLCKLAVETAITRLGFDRAGVWLISPTDPDSILGTWGVDVNGSIVDERNLNLKWRGASEIVVPESIATLFEQARAEKTVTQIVERNAKLSPHLPDCTATGDRLITTLWDGEDAVGFLSIDMCLSNRHISPEDQQVAALLGSILGASVVRSTVEQEHGRQAVEELRSEMEQRTIAESELWKQRNLLRALIDSLPDRVYIKNVDGRYIISNRFHWASVGAQSEAEVLGKTCFDIFPADLAQRYHQKDQEIMASAKAEEGFIERSIIRGETGDEDRWFMSWKIPLLGPNGEVSGVVGISTDYTKQKEAEELRAAHFRYMETVNLFSEAVSKNETSEGLVQAVMSLIHERLDCRGLWVFHPIPDDGEFPGLAYWRNCQDSQLAIALSRPVRLKEMLRADCAISFIEAGHNCLGTIVRPKVGDPWAIIVARDTDQPVWNLEERRVFNETMVRFGDALNRIMLRESLQESEERHRALFENSIDGIYRCAVNGRFLDVNPSFVRMLGYDRQEEVLNLDPKELVFQPPQFEFAKEQVAESCELRRRNGEHLFIEVSTHAVNYQGGEIAHFEGIVRDISDRQKMHEAMLHTQKLESLGVLAGGIAHDFNNLLAVILGNADLARAELDPNSSVRESIEQIELASRRGSELCKQMLAYSGKGHFVIQPLSINDVVNEMTHLLEISINKGVIMRYRMFNQLPAILADATQIRQVIMNLVINASDAIGDRSGVVTISTGVFSADSAYLTEAFLAKELPEGDYVYMEVSDTGVGMDAETQAKIFDPFFSTKFTGRGLGLAAVLGIVRGHKGAMKVYSEKGVGSTFKVLLPASESLAIREANPDDSAKAKQYEGIALVVDDELPVRTMAKRMVEKLGFTAVTADNGMDGIKAYEKHSGEIKFVLLDMTMPVLAGDGAFREILRIDPNAKVILTSGYNEEDATARFAGKGLAGFLQKPFRLAELRTVVEKALGV